MSRKLFLIGGHDLEMATIVQLLEQEGYSYIDHSLAWHNAKLSSYQEQIATYADSPTTLYGIELQEDITPPCNYVTIDHHNYHNHALSALEQVATHIGYTLDRHQQLVAANDRGYIPAMLALGATDAEVAQIRLLDREAQGVTPQQEELAIQAIATKRSLYGGQLLVVQARCPKFSPICDRLYPYERLLVYTLHELTYYGKQAQQLRVQMPHSAILYYGGGEHGYWGVPRDALSETEITTIVNNVIKQLETRCQ